MPAWADLGSMNVIYRFPTEDPVPPPRPRTRRGSRLLLGIGALALLAMSGSAWFLGGSGLASPVAMADDIESFISRTALHRALEGPAGGVLGPWWIHATGSDPDTGDILGLCLEGNDTQIAAARASVEVDSETDTLLLRLHDVVVVTLPDKNRDGHVAKHDTLLLGPIPMSVDIQDDPGPARH
ncbi:MAG: hypothetical protein MK116_13135 [Phycisphaerales bacterium]|nr:hypothetical protein [Phycisphaerales bacterium]